jgi:hypothetical protein
MGRAHEKAFDCQRLTPERSVIPARGRQSCVEKRRKEGRKKNDPLTKTTALKKRLGKGEPWADFTDSFCLIALVASEFCCYNIRGRLNSIRSRARKTPRNEGCPSSWPLKSNGERRKAVISIDDRFMYGEERRIAFAPMRGRLYAVCYVLRGQTRRIISFRKANKREERLYAKATADE